MGRQPRTRVGRLGAIAGGDHRERAAAVLASRTVQAPIEQNHLLEGSTLSPVGVRNGVFAPESIDITRRCHTNMTSG